MISSSNSIRVLPLVAGKSGRHTHSHKLVLASILNMKRLSKLDRQLAASGQKHKYQMEHIMQESRVCEVQLIQLLRSGQFSSVHKVRLRSNGRHLALKKIMPDERYENREEQLCRKLKSNFIVRTVDIYHGEKGQINILMQLYDWNLKDFILGQQRLDYLTYKTICYRMVRSLFYLHSRGVTHRDIRPENFLMRKNGRVVLCDFGSAKNIKKEESSIAYLNSRSYRAPQLLLGSTLYSSSVDIWALGCVMIELITKKEIFRGSSTIDCLLNICRVFGSKDLKKIKEGEQLIRLLPTVKGISLGQCLHDVGCPILIDLLSKMLKVRAQERIRAVQILVHPFFDQLREEVTFNQIIRQKMDISDFFTFSTDELSNCEGFRTKLLPVWKRDRLGKHVSALSPFIKL